MRRSGVLPDKDSDEERSDNDDDDGDVAEAHEDKECVPSLVRDTTMKETAKVRSIGFPTNTDQYRFRNGCRASTQPMDVDQYRHLSVMIGFSRGLPISASSGC